MGKYENVILLWFVGSLHFSCFESLKRIPPSTCYIVTLNATSPYHPKNKQPNEANIVKVTNLLTLPNQHETLFKCNHSKLELNNTIFKSSKTINKSKLVLEFLVEPNDRNKKIEAYSCAENANYQVTSTHDKIQNLLQFRRGLKPILTVGEESCCEKHDPLHHCCITGYILENDTCVEVAPTVTEPVETSPTVTKPVDVSPMTAAPGELVNMEENEENCNPSSPRLSLGLIIVVTVSSLIFLVGVVVGTIYVWRPRKNDGVTSISEAEEAPPITTSNSQEPLTNTIPHPHSQALETSINTKASEIPNDEEPPLAPTEEKTPDYEDMRRTTSSGSRPPSHPEMTMEFTKNIRFEDISFTGTILGSGQFGHVELVKITMINTTVECAAKMIKGRGTIEDERALFEELQMLYRIPHHVNVVNLLGGCMEEDKPLYVLVEYCSNGNLLKYLQSYKNSHEYVNVTTPKLDFGWKLKRAIDICSGMVFLGQNQIIHCDLAARNILLDNNEVAKICDFGMAKDVYLRGLYIKKTSGFLPVRWMAIEAIESSIYTTKSDMWSFGILLWELFMDGQSPYPAVHDTHELLDCIKEGYRMIQPEGCPDEFYNLMLRCWSKNPDDRPLFPQAKRELRLIKEEERRKESAGSRETEFSDDSSVFEEQKEQETTTNNQNGIVNYGLRSSNSSDDFELKPLEKSAENTRL